MNTCTQHIMLTITILPTRLPTYRPTNLPFYLPIKKYVLEPLVWNSVIIYLVPVLVITYIITVVARGRLWWGGWEVVRL